MDGGWTTQTRDAFNLLTDVGGIMTDFANLTVTHDLKVGLVELGSTFNGHLLYPHANSVNSQT